METRKKILACLLCLFCSFSNYAQNTKQDSLQFARTIVRILEGNTANWEQTEWGERYFKALDSLEKEYTGRLEGEVFLQKKNQLKVQWRVPELLTAQRIYNNQIRKQSLYEILNETEILRQREALQDSLIWEWEKKLNK